MAIDADHVKNESYLVHTRLVVQSAQPLSNWRNGGHVYEPVGCDVPGDVLQEDC